MGLIDELRKSFKGNPSGPTLANSYGLVKPGSDQHQFNTQVEAAKFKNLLKDAFLNDKTLENLAGEINHAKKAQGTIWDQGMDDGKGSLHNMTDFLLNVPRRAAKRVWDKL